ERTSAAPRYGSEPGGVTRAPVRPGAAADVPGRDEDVVLVVEVVRVLHGELLAVVVGAVARGAEVLHHGRDLGVLVPDVVAVLARLLVHVEERRLLVHDLIDRLVHRAEERRRLHRAGRVRRVARRQPARAAARR